MVSINCQNFLDDFLYFSSEELKEAISVKSQSLQTLQDENNKLTQERDNSHKDQSDLVKVLYILKKKSCITLQASD